ncbi:MAG: redoxin domain-containing protein [Georgenia sp.]
MTAAGRDVLGRRLSADLALVTPDGGAARLGDLATEDWLVIQLVRYFGCLPCQEWLIGLDAAAPDLAALGARAAAVGGSADFQAKWLRDERGVQMPLLLDPGNGLRDAVGAGARLGIRLADPRGLAAYAGALARGARPQRITADTVRSPGVVVLDRDLSVRWVHVGRRIGDYPTLGKVVNVVRALASTGGA